MSNKAFGEISFEEFDQGLQEKIEAYDTRLEHISEDVSDKANIDHTHENLPSRGPITALTGAELPTIRGLSVSEIYNNGYPMNYGNMLTINGKNGLGCSQLALGWSGTSGAYAPAYIRSKRDIKDAPWSEWGRVYTTLDKPTPTEIGAMNRSPRNTVFGSNQNTITTVQFITLLTSLGAFDNGYWVTRGTWNYAGNQMISDTGCGNIHLAGCVVEVFSESISAYTIRITTPTTSINGTNSGEFIYINNGSQYSPAWRRSYNTINKPSASDIGAVGTGSNATLNRLTLSDYGTPFECSQYIDFHQIGTNVDYSVRLTGTSGLLTSSGGMTVSNSNGNLKRTTISTANPSGGSNGDVWIKYS